MAAEPRSRSESLGLPPRWSHGVSRDGRIFFINEEAQSTTWLHPVTGEAVATGHRKTPDLPTGWEEGYTFEGARCFINHNERKVTCKHPVSGVPSQDNCIFVVNEHVGCGKLVHPGRADETLHRPPAPPAPPPDQEECSSGERKDRPLSTMSEASNFTGGSDYSTVQGSPPTTTSTTTRTSNASNTNTSSRPSRSSKKVHNFGKRSNSIRRNPNAPVVKSSWLYKQDSTGMKLWKKRWFVLSDMCLFYYRDEKEEAILGSILLPSFHISMLSVDDHISRKYAFKATHPNMRTYYFCTDTAKEMESWMKLMTDAALVHTEPIRRTDKSKADQRTPQELNNLLNHRVLTQPEIQNNERNRERQHSLSRLEGKRPRDGGLKEREYYTLQRDGERYSLKKDGVSYTLQKEGEKYLFHKDGEKYLLRKDGEKFSLHKDQELYGVHRELEKHAVHKLEHRYTEGKYAKDEEKYLLTQDGEKYAPAKDGEKYLLTKDGGKYAPAKNQEKYIVAKDGEKYLFTKDGEKYNLAKDGQKYLLAKDGEKCALAKDQEKYIPAQDGEKYLLTKEVEKYAPAKDVEKYLLSKDGEKLALARVLERHSLQRDPQKVGPQKEVRRQLSLRETDRFANARDKYGTVHVVDKYGTLKEVRKYSTLREGNKYATLREAEKYATLRNGERFCFQRDGSAERSLAKISSVKLQPSQAAAIAAAVNASRHAHLNAPAPAQMNGGVLAGGEQQGDGGSAEMDRLTSPPPGQEVERRESGLSRTNSMQQLEHWVRTQRTRSGDEDTRSVTSYQTLPRNMPSHRPPQLVARYPEGYRTLPRNSLMRPESISSVAGSTYDRALRPASTSAVAPPTSTAITPSVGSSTLTAAEKRRSMRDDTMWQLYEWQQRQAFSRQSLALPSAAGHYGTLPNTKTMSNISELVAPPSIPASPSHGSLALYGTLPHPQQHKAPPSNPGPAHSDLPSPSPALRGDTTLDRRHRAYLAKYGFPPERRSIAAAAAHQPITAQSLQDKTVTPDDFKDPSVSRPNAEEDDIDTKLSRLCEQDKAVRTQEEKLQQLHREKHTLETALLSAIQELSEQSVNDSTNQSLIQQRDVLQSGLLSSCREETRVSTELERSWREYDRLEADVTLAKTNLLETLEALGSPQTEPPSQRHIQIQKELWRIQDVMEALTKNKPRRRDSVPASKPLSSQQKNEQAPDYRLYKSEPELTTVKEEGDEAPPDDREKTEGTSEGRARGERERGAREGRAKGEREKKERAAPPYPVGVVPPRTKSPLSQPESSTIASYVTLRKTRRPEQRPDRPRSAADQPLVGDREVGRTRMSVEEQLERMRRNQEASSLRERRRERETPSRSPSFSRDNPALPTTLQTDGLTPQTDGLTPQTDGLTPDPLALEAALQQLKVQTEEEETRRGRKVRRFD